MGETTRDDGGLRAALDTCKFVWLTGVVLWHATGCGSAPSCSHPRPPENSLEINQVINLISTQVAVVAATRAYAHSPTLAAPHARAAPPGPVRRARAESYG